MTKERKSARRTRVSGRSLRPQLLAIMVLGVAVGVYLIYRILAAPLTGSLEGEALASTTNQAIALNGANGGKALRLLSADVATGRITSTRGSTLIHMRMKGDQCQGAPIVTLRINGRDALTASVSSASLTTYTAGLVLPSGAHSVTAALTNPGGKSKGTMNCARAAYIDILQLRDDKRPAPLQDKTRPTVSLSGPPNGATVSGTVNVAASSGDSVSVAKVEFYVNSALASTVNAFPYNYAWDTTVVSNGSYTLSAKAYDAAGNVGMSAGRRVTVNNSAGSVELMKAVYPNAFVFQDGTPAKINGLNVRDGGIHLNSPADPNDNYIYPQSRWAEVRSKGFNALRLALNWPEFEPAQGQLRADALKALDTTVAQAKTAGLYIILDPIHLKSRCTNMPAWVTGIDCIDKLNRHASAYIKEIAQRYKDEPGVIAIDLVNEPYQSGTLNNTRTMHMYDRLITVVRGVDTDKILIVEPTWGNSGLAKVDWNVLTDKSNVVMAYHDYYAGGHATGWDSAGIPRGIYTWPGNGYDSPDRAALAANLDTFLDWLVAPRLPLYVGEYGIHKNARNGSQWLTHMVSVLNTRNLPRSYWEWHGAGPSALTDPNWTWSPYTDLAAEYS